MSEFLKKYGSKIVSGGVIAAWFGALGTAVASLVRGDRRQQKYYEKQNELQEEQLTYWRNLNKKKES